MFGVGHTLTAHTHTHTVTDPRTQHSKQTPQLLSHATTTVHPAPNTVQTACSLLGAMIDSRSEDRSCLCGVVCVSESEGSCAAAVNPPAAHSSLCPAGSCRCCCCIVPALPSSAAALTDRQAAHRSSQSRLLGLLLPLTALLTTLNTTDTIRNRNIICSRPPKKGIGMIGMILKPPKPKPPP